MDDFYVNENVCKGCEINLPKNKQARDELTKLCLDVAKEGVSVLAREVATNRIVGIMFNKIQVNIHIAPAHTHRNVINAAFLHSRRCPKTMNSATLNCFAINVLSHQMP